MGTHSTTNIVLIGTDFNNLVKFSDFKSVEDFKSYLNDNNFTYNEEEGRYINEIDDIVAHIFICEKEYYENTGHLSEWCHLGTQMYLNRLSKISWDEESESVWNVYVRSYSKLTTADEIAEGIFNDLKAIDCIEIELVCPDDKDDYPYNVYKYQDDGEYQGDEYEYLLSCFSD